MTEQLELHIPRSGVDDAMLEQLSDLVEQFNAEADHERRVELYGRMRRLRRLLGIGGES